LSNGASEVHHTFRAARDYLQDHREDYDTAYREFAWPQFTEFNWALDWFDQIARDPANADRYALWIVEEDGTEGRWTYPEMSRRSNQVANWLRAQGVRRGDRLILMLGNHGELWETILAAIKLGAVIIPASTLLGPADLRDRVDRGAAKHVVVRSADTPKFADVTGGYTRIAVGEPTEGWLSYADAYSAPEDFTADGPTRAEDPLLLYFTSGTTAKPKLVLHRFRTPSVICLQCTGSVSNRGMSTSTSPRRAGRSTPGATCSRRGTPKPPCFSTITNASTPSP
jgi:acetyl-CoA synthetase